MIILWCYGLDLLYFLYYLIFIVLFDVEDWYFRRCLKLVEFVECLGLVNEFLIKYKIK